MAPIEFKPRQTVVFEGDSLTALRRGQTHDQWPWLRISNNHRSWADTFSELVFAWRPDLALQFRLAAVGGSSCRELDERLEPVVAPLRPDWILLTLGSNDATREIPLDEFEATLRRYAARSAEWGGRLVFLYNVQACPNASQAAIDKVEKRRPYYAVEEALGAELPNVHLIDIGSPLLEKARLHYDQYPGHSVYSDGTHFSNLGGMIVAGEVLKACGIVV